MKKISFIKMHGLGNDFVMLDFWKKRPVGFSAGKVAKRICDRASGVGADGLIVLLRGRKNPFRMRVYNADGSEAEMCGNGFRCLIRMIHDRKYSFDRFLPVETKAGIIQGEILKKSKHDFLVRVAMGRPEFDLKKIGVKSRKKEFLRDNLKIGRDSHKVSIVSMGNPHAVLYLRSFNLDWRDLGQKIENHCMFPHRTNVEFARKINRKKIELKSWERGAGETMASGTGASAAVAVGIKNGLLDRKVAVQFELGTLMIEQEPENGIIYSTGPSEYAFEGSYFPG